MDFTVQGQHYGYELFLLEQPSWGSRGAPFLWAYLSRHFSDIPLPMDEDFLVSEYMKIIKEFKIPFGKDEYVYVERFAAGGMIGGTFVKDGLEMLCKYLQLYK